MRDQMPSAHLVSKSAIRLLWFPIVMALLIEPNGVFAQAGSTGGSVGKQDKSVSGTQNDNVEPGATKRVSSAPSKKQQPRTGTGSLALYNGTWGGLSTGACIPNYNWTVQVSNGIITGNNCSGFVSRVGYLRASMIVNGQKYDVIGHANSSQASGTWVSTGNCSGRWTAAKS